MKPYVPEDDRFVPKCQAVHMASPKTSKAYLFGEIQTGVLPACGIEERLFANACSHGKDTRDFQSASTRITRIKCSGLPEAMAKEAQNDEFSPTKKIGNAMIVVH